MKMSSIDNIRDEHESIIVFLMLLDEIFGRLPGSKRVDPLDLRWLFEFFREYVIKNHFRKEEQFLYPILQDLGIPSCYSYLLAEEHEMLGSLAKQIRGQIEDLIEGRRFAPSDLLETGNAFLDLLSGHLKQEEAVLFPLLQAGLSAEMDDRLADRLWIFEEEGIGEARGQELQEILYYLKDFYGIEIGS